VLQMTSVQMLRAYPDTGATIYTILKTARIEDRSKLQKPFEQLDPQEVILMIYEWLYEQERGTIRVQLRMHDHNHGIMHHVGIRTHNRHISVQYVHDLPSNQQQITHVWKPATTSMNLTVEEIHASVARAQEINQLTATQQAYSNVPRLDTLLETWMPEINEIEDPQLIDHKSNFQTIEEWLQEENLI